MEAAKSHEVEDVFRLDSSFINIQAVLIATLEYLLFRRRGESIAEVEIEKHGETLPFEIYVCVQ
jgi:hypothetical protein